MRRQTKNSDSPGEQGSLLRPGEIQRAQGRSGASGFRSRPDIGTPGPDAAPAALRLESLPGHRALAQAPATAAEGRPTSTTSTASSPRDRGAARILERREIAPGLLRLRVERPSAFEYRAGQHVKFGLPRNLRSYTLVSAPHEPHLEFFIELQPGGRLSEPLRSVGESTRTALGPAAKGSFVIDSAVSNHVFVATVTGIAPFVSMLRDQARRGFSAGRFIILHGASYAQELGYGDELGALAAARPDRIQYLPTVSRPQEARNSGWTGATGRVDTHLEPALRDPGLPAGDTAIYACGHSGMIRNVRAVARRHGLRFHSEAFD
mgnify:CR=1 FL=1